MVGKVICINKIEGITLGKTYKVLAETITQNSRDRFYYISDDNGKIGEYNTKHFETLSSVRDRKLNELLNTNLC